jgi:hypothetical protein
MGAAEFKDAFSMAFFFLLVLGCISRWGFGLMRTGSLRYLLLVVVTK